MKKLMFAVAAVAAGVALADVEGSNIVGYQNHDWMERTYYQLVNNFDGVGEDGVEIDKIFKFDNVPVYNKNTYKTLCPSVAIMDLEGEGSKEYWYTSNGDEPETFSWRNSTKQKVTDLKIAPGQCFWYHDTCSDNSAINFNGEVMTDVFWTKLFPNQYIMLGNPYPTDITLADITFENLEETAPLYNKNTYKTLATEIDVSDVVGEGSAAYWFVKESDGSYSWRNSTKQKVAASSIVIPAGRSGWFHPNAAAGESALGGVRVTINNPLNK